MLESFCHHGHSSKYTEGMVTFNYNVTVSNGVDLMPYMLMGHTKFTTSGAHDVIAITSPQKNDFCTEELRDRAQVMKLPGHWTRSVYHLEEL